MTQPFEVQSYVAGATRKGCAITLAPMTPKAAKELGGACADMGPWNRYGIDATALTATFAVPSGGGAFRYQIEVEGTLVGVLIVLHPWLVGPYVQFLAVLPSWQGQHVGQAVLHWFETQARANKQRNIWLCVTGFNASARAFYEAQGWQEAATIPNLVQSGVDEVMLRKQLF
jgi:ribosomal protein S18 acetylase RimI-like enzyme